MYAAGQQVREGYQGIIGPMHVSLADSYYEKYKNKPLETIKRFENVLVVKNIFDAFDFFFDDHRKSKFAAIRRILREDYPRKLEKKSK